MKILIRKITVILLILTFGCQDLDVANPNQPGTGNINDDVINALASGAMVNVLDAYSLLDDGGDFFPSNVHLAFTADHTTSTNNFKSFWSQFKTEPRVVFNNSLTFPDLNITGNPWGDWNAAVAQANQVIKLIEEVPEDERSDSQAGALGLAYMAKGMALGYLANAFDQAFVVPLDADLSTLDPKTVLRPYGEVLSASLEALDEAIAIFSSGITYSSPTTTFNGKVYTASDLAAYSNTFAAHYIVSNARTSTQNSATDWAAVRDYALAGSNADFLVTDDGQFFSHDFFCLTGLFWYFRIDHRVLRHFNQNYPKRFALETDAVIAEDVLTGTGYNGDERLTKYFTYSADLSFFNLTRGPQLRSHYYQGQFETFFTEDNCIGDVRYSDGYMNQLLLAEAYNELGNTPAAIAILDADDNPRNAVGNLPDITTGTQAEIRQIINAERDIELGRTIYGVEHFDMRRRGQLQIGTILHFPVPASELATIGLDVYTFGGVTNADGINTADGTNSWLND